MRILILTERFPPEIRSAAELFADLAGEFRRQGHDVAVFTRLPSHYLSPRARQAPKPGWDVVRGIPTFRVKAFPDASRSPLIRGIEHVALAYGTWRALREWPGADLVLVYSPPLTLAEVAIRHQRRFGTPFILNVQDLYPQTAMDLGLLKNPCAIMLGEKMEQRAYKRAATIVVHSEGNRDFLVNRKGVPREKVRVISNWVNTEAVFSSASLHDFRKEHGLDGKFVVSYAGVMGYAQDLTPVFRCAELMRDQEGVVFLLVGEGAFEGRWRQMAEELNLRNVRFLPMQEKPDYLALLKASDACLVPLAAGLRTPVVPGKIQSIMASGRPVLAILSPEGDGAKIVQEIGAGFVVEPGEPERLMETIRYLRGNPGVGEEMGRRGRAFAERHFSLKRAAAAYNELFSELPTTGVKGGGLRHSCSASG